MTKRSLAAADLYSHPGPLVETCPGHLTVRPPPWPDCSPVRDGDTTVFWNPRRHTQRSRTGVTGNTTGEQGRGLPRVWWSLV